MSTVLVVDDSDFSRDLFRRYLKILGHTVAAEAEDAQGAVEKYQRFHPDVVLMDFMLLESNGLSALKGIKAVDPNAKVIFVSSVGQDTVVRQVMAAGACALLTKPIDLTTLRAAVRQALEGPAEKPPPPSAPPQEPKKPAS
jgi:two-component system chemotaxis response regulator CheY